VKLIFDGLDTCREVKGTSWLSYIKCARAIGL